MALWALAMGCAQPLYHRDGTDTQADAGLDAASQMGATGGGPGPGDGTGGATGGRTTTGGAASGGSPTGGGATGGSAGGTTTGGVATGGAAAMPGTGAGGQPATGGKGTGGSADGGRGGSAPATGGHAGATTGGTTPTGGQKTGGSGGASGGGGGKAPVGGNGGQGATGGTGGAAIAGAVVHCSFDETSGTTAHDDAGPTAQNATLSGATFVAGRFGNALSFSGSSQYASFATGLSADLSDMTVAFWVNLGVKTSYQRVIDCGNSQSTGSWFVSPSYGASGLLRFAITKTDWTVEQGLDGPVLPLNQWKHVAVVLGAEGATMYVDGVVAANSATVTLRPKDIGGVMNAWLGRSQYANDPYFNGRLDDFYLFGRALSADEIVALMRGP